MIQILRMTAAGTAVLLAGAGLAGCGSGGSTTTSVFATCLTPKEPVALAIGARSNSP